VQTELVELAAAKKELKAEAETKVELPKVSEAPKAEAKPKAKTVGKKAEAAKPAKLVEAEQTELPLDEPTITVEQAKEALKQYAIKNGKDKAVAKLAEFGASKLSEVASTRLGEFMSRLEGQSNDLFN
jgi:hypothetical protein